MTEFGDLSDLVCALKAANYRRVAVQVRDDELASALDLIAFLQAQLPNSLVSLLGDSVTDCCLDEVAAEHYGSDCIVKLGHSCWFASQRIVAYFITKSSVSGQELCETYLAARRENPEGPIVVFVDSMKDLDELRKQDPALLSELYICLSPCVSYPGSNKPAINWFNVGPFSSVGTLAIARFSQEARREYPRVAGRLLFKYGGQGVCEQLLDPRVVARLVDTFSTTFILNRSDSLYNRVINRFGTRPGRVITCPSAGQPVPAGSNYKELLRRYRGVEAVKDSSVIGIVVTHCAASEELFKVRDLLALFLRAAGKEVHMFSMNKAEGVKLGNFPEIECFIVMSCPESEFFESGDLMAACVSPFEALVSMESLDWSDHVITDYDEMLSRMILEPPPRTPRTPRRKKIVKAEPVDPTSVKLGPAKIEMGLRGIPSRYVSEPSGTRS